MDYPDLDLISIEDLRARRAGEKWTRYPDCIGAFVAEMDFGTAPAVAQALHEAVDRSAFGYLPDVLVEHLADALSAAYTDRFGWEVAPDRIRPVSDVIKAAEMALRLFTPEGAKVILPTPNYMPFISLPRLVDMESIEVPMVKEKYRWELDLDAIDAAFRSGGHTVILCNPSNPTGRVYESEELISLAEIVERHGGRVFSDEIHAPLTYSGHRHVPYASLNEATAAHTLTATSASKAWNIPGVKCAQLMFSNRDDLTTWELKSDLAAYGASTLGVIANTAAYRGGWEWLEGILDYLAVNRALTAELIGDLMPDVDHFVPEGTFLAWLDMRRSSVAARAGVDSATGKISPRSRLSELLREEAGVAVTDGSDCGIAGRGFIRFNFATPRPILEEALRRIAEVHNR